MLSIRLLSRLAFASVILACPSLAHAATDAALLPRDLSPWGMFTGADIVVKAVIVGLALASVATWTIWLAKTLELQRDIRRAHRGIAALEGGGTLAQLARDSGNDAHPVAQIVQSAMRERELSAGADDDGLLDRVALRLERVEASAARQSSRGTGVLATIGATAPFVGLFGTVWGIMNAFIGISEARTTNLAVVAPGIAEALLATALGLVAAIPAVVIYNHLARRIAAYRALLTDSSALTMLHISRAQHVRRAPRAHAAE